MSLVILDRDGVINQHSDDHIKSPEALALIPGSLEAIARLNHAGFRVVVATNQPGVGRKLFDIEMLMRIHERLHRQLAEVGGNLEAIFFCPHVPRDRCSCRKPRPGMLMEIGKRLRVSLDNVPVSLFLASALICGLGYGPTTPASASDSAGCTSKLSTMSVTLRLAVTAREMTLISSAA